MDELQLHRLFLNDPAFLMRSDAVILSATEVTTVRKGDRGSYEINTGLRWVLGSTRGKLDRGPIKGVWR